MTQGIVRQSALPKLDLAGIPVIVSHVVIQTADDFRSHILQEDVRPADTVKILADTLADSCLFLFSAFFQSFEQNHPYSAVRG